MPSNHRHPHLLRRHKERPWKTSVQWENRSTRPLSAATLSLPEKPGSPCNGDLSTASDIYEKSGTSRKATTRSTHDSSSFARSWSGTGQLIRTIYTSWQTTGISLSSRKRKLPRRQKTARCCNLDLSLPKQPPWRRQPLCMTLRQNECANAAEGNRRSLDSRIDAKYRKIDGKRDRIKKLEEDLSEVNAKISKIKGKHQVDISIKTAAVTAAGATMAKLSADIAKKGEMIEGAQARIDRCNYVVAHPEETPALKTKLERGKKTIAQLEQEARSLEEHLRTLAEGSKTAKRFIVVLCCGFLGAILLVGTYACSEKLPKTVEAASPTSSSSSYAPKTEGSSASPMHTRME